MLRLLILVVALVAVALTTQALAEEGNLITNGDFEQGDTGFSSDLVSIPPMPPMMHGQYTVFTNPSTMNGAWCGADHTSGSGNLLICDGIQGSETVAWRQSVSVQPNVQYTFGAWVNNLVCSQSIADPVIELRANGAVVAGPLTLPENSAQWMSISGLFTAQGSSVTLEIVSTSTAKNGNDFGIDDVTLCPPMEASVTSTLSFIGLAAALVLVGAVLHISRRT